LPDLQFVPTGKTPSQPAELLASSKMHELLAVWRDQFDYVVIDAPPVCVVTDAVVLGTQADAIVLVVRWSCTTRHAMLRARDLLLRAHTHIAGTVLNGVDSRYLDSYYFNPRGYVAKTSSAAYYDVHVQ
jgi:Mrp family chromosome partitioning ATPase